MKSFYQTFLPINLDHLQFPGALKHKMRQHFERNIIPFAFKLVYIHKILHTLTDTLNSTIQSCTKHFENHQWYCPSFLLAFTLWWVTVENVCSFTMTRD